MLVLALAGCDTAVPGNPGVASTGTSATSKTAPMSTTTAPATSSSVTLEGRQFDPEQLCALLDPADAQRLGGGDKGRGTFSTTTAAPLCSFSRDTVLILSFLQNSQTKDIHAEPGVTVNPTKVDGLTAVQVRTNKQPLPMCEVYVDINSTSLLVFSAGLQDSGKGKYEECDVATKLANVVIPKIKV
nr:DUF3558 domain-containing protein [Actinokineospora enzanensis]